jgi:MinD-like ATPase involved in chromosome partitioning or flagellar assembly
MADEKIRKINITADVGKGKLKIKFNPKPTFQEESIGEYLNILLDGVSKGLQHILARIPMMRPPTQLEEENHLYVFANAEEDNKLYNARKYLYMSISEAFNTTLKNLFPDIVFIDSTTEARREAVLQMSQEDAEVYKKEIEQLTEKIKEQFVNKHEQEYYDDDEEEIEA